MQLLIVNTDAKPAPRLSANRPENAKGLRPKGFQELIWLRSVANWLYSCRGRALSKTRGAPHNTLRK